MRERGDGGGGPAPPQVKAVELGFAQGPGHEACWNLFGLSIEFHAHIFLIRALPRAIQLARFGVCKHCTNMLFTNLASTTPRLLRSPYLFFCGVGLLHRRGRNDSGVCLPTPYALPVMFTPRRGRRRCRASPPRVSEIRSQLRAGI